MKPFDLVRAQAGDPIQTRDGRLARFVAYIDDAEPSYRVVALLTGEKEVRQYSEDGVWSITGGSDPRDLFMEPKKRTVYVNLYAKTNPVSTNAPGKFAVWHETAHAAESLSDREAVAIAVPIEIED